MKRRADAGFSLLEMLAVTAIFGLCVVTVAELHGGLLREVRHAEREDDAFQRRELALMRFRAAIRRATVARQAGERIVLAGDAGESTWCVSGGIPAGAGPGTACEPGALRAERRARGMVIRLSGHDGDEIILVGIAGGVR